MNFFLFFFIFISFQSGIALKCEISRLSNLFELGLLNDTTPETQECASAADAETLLSKLGTFGKLLYNKTGFSCFTVAAVPHLSVLKEATIKGCMPRGGCPLVEAAFSVIKASGTPGVAAAVLFKEVKCMQCVGDMCNSANLTKTPTVGRKDLICEVSRITDLLESGKTAGIISKIEPCLDSPPVRALLKEMGFVENFIDSNILFTCFTITGTTGTLSVPIGIRGCMPMMGCDLVEAYFSFIKQVGELEWVPSRTVFKEVKCVECASNRCNAALEKSFSQNRAEKRKLSCSFIAVLALMLYDFNF